MGKACKMSKSIPTDFDSEKLKELRLYALFSFVLWPIIVIMALYKSLRYFITACFSRQHFSRCLHLLPFFAMYPYNLSKLAWNEKNYRAFCGMLLIFPLLVAVIMSIFYIPFYLMAGMEPYSGIPYPPFFFKLFGIMGKGIFGTNSEGLGMGQLVVLGAGYTYFSTVITVAFVFVLGIWLGKKTFDKRYEPLIMGFMEMTEAIPILFILLVGLAVFSWWGDEFKDIYIFGTAFQWLRAPIIGLGIGIGFLPRMVRIIRERIKTFESENFINAAKAHGIDQDRILSFHIIRKNCMRDIIIVITQIWAAAILVEISLDYLVSISPFLGAKLYRSWAQMLIDSKDYILFLKYWWLWVVPGFFIISTVVGFFLFGDGLRAFHRQRLRQRTVTPFDSMLKSKAQAIGLIK